MSEIRCLPSWYEGSPLSVARRMLGCVLVRADSGGRTSGIIVEVEAYLSHHDPASHSSRGLSRKNQSMFLSAGSLYVYSIHSRYCLNIVTEPAGTGSAILVRALDPIEGCSMMERRRRSDPAHRRLSPIARLRHLSSGPGRLCEALGVDRQLDGIDLTTSDSIWIEPPPQFVLARSWEICTTQRIGIRQGAELPLRFFIDGHQLVSGSARHHTLGRKWRFEVSSFRPP